MSDANRIREAIRSELDRRGWPIVRLAEDPALAGRISREMVFKYLAGRNDLATDRAALLLDLLDLKVS